MAEAGEGDDWSADWAAGEEVTKEGGRVEEEYAEDGLIQAGVGEAMAWG